MPARTHLVFVFILAALAAGATAAQGMATGRSRNAGQQTVSITARGATLAITGPTRWQAGAVRIEAVSHDGEQEFTLLRFAPGYSYARFLADSTVANGRSPRAHAAFLRLFRKAHFLGGVNVFPNEPASFTTTLASGTYYLGELTSRPVFRRIIVSGAKRAGSPVDSPLVIVSDSGYRVPRGLPATGTITIRSTGSQVHRLLFVPVEPGTTRAQVGVYLRKTGGRPHGPPPPFARRGPQVGTSMISPGHQIEFSYSLPAGEYALLGLQSDVRTGKPQTLEGLYEVATLR